MPRELAGHTRIVTRHDIKRKLRRNAWAPMLADRWFGRGNTTGLCSVLARWVVRTGRGDAARGKENEWDKSVAGLE